MSIRGIDAQIMVQRTTDTIRDVSALQKHPQIAQETIAARNIEESTSAQSRVLQATESEMENIRTDVDEEGSGAGGGGGSGGEEEEEEEMTEEQKKELLVAPAAHEQIIDIMV